MLNGLPWTWTEITVIFETAPKYCIVNSLIDYEGCFISSRAFCPQYYVKWSCELNSPFPSILVHWFLRCWCSILPSPPWSHPIYLDSWTKYSRCLCSIILYNIRLHFHHQTHPPLSIVSALAHPLHSSWSYFSPLPCSILDTYWPRGSQQYDTFWCHIVLPFHTVHGVLKARDPWPCAGIIIL